MTKSKNGCLKILVCAGAGSDRSAGSDADADDHADENKATSDKSRWSFCRRSTRHRVLKNSDISEPETLSSSKAKAEVAPGNNVYSSTYSYASEKPLHLEKPDEKSLHLEKPDEKPLHLEKLDEKPLHLEKPDEKPLHLEKLDEKLLDEQKLNEEPVEKPTEKPEGQIAEKSAEQHDEKITGMLSEEPAERITEEPIEEPAEKAVEELDEKQDESISISLTDLKQEKAASHNDGSSVDLEEDHVESAAVVIQSGIRTYIARQELSNHKDLVKLQAVIRGHLVRRQAAESLQCLLAIVKVQELTRAHQAQQSAGMFQDTLVRSSSEKLLQNGFAVKLMDSVSTSKSMNIRCDPCESDATWKWMERWTTLILPTTGNHLLENSGLVVEKMEEDAHEEDNIVPLNSDISFPKLVPDDVEDTLKPSDSITFVEETLCPSDSRTLEAPASVTLKTSGWEIKDDSEPQLIEKINEDAEQLTDLTTENVVDQSLVFSGQLSTQTDPSKESDSLPENSELSNNDIIDAYKNEQTLEMDGKSVVARKFCNPAFAAAQMKFEELTSNSTVSRSNSSSYHDGTSKSKVHTPRSQDGASPKQNSDASIPEIAVARDPKAILAASECGTEISISSTLDSPDRSEADGGEIVLEIGSLGDRNYTNDNADKDTHILHSEVNNTCEGVVQPEKEEENSNIADPVTATDAVLVEQAYVGLEKLDLHDQLERSVESYVKSPEGTPMSRTTFAESHGTPSSEVSVNTTKSKSKKPKSRVSRRSLTSPSSNSVGRSSTDNFSKDYKHAKRENSVKAAKANNVDQEPRMSNSTPLPSYMQFTESARAKAAASISPKLSPDVQDSNPRKRHSLPIANGKQETSPRMQRSSSQAQQNTKSSIPVPHNPSDKRWNI